MNRIVRSNFHVVVWPAPYWSHSDKDTCKEIMAQIKRHIDDVDRIEIDCDVEEVCEFCERTWEVDKDGCPECCDAAQQEWMEYEKKKTGIQD